MKHNASSFTALSLAVILFGTAGLTTFAQTTAKKPSTKTTTKARAKKTNAEVKYKAHCGMIYSAADAKKYHYICPMDHKPLVKITSAIKIGQHGAKK
ncbi:MAG TPA: hypothetical protein VFB38_25385 [Chthonomonadaceae bacterium]|nr:hypothetical protein [Chthonomonadaceae bacterium]